MLISRRLFCSRCFTGRMPVWQLMHVQGAPAEGSIQQSSKPLKQTQGCVDCRWRRTGTAGRTPTRPPATPRGRPRRRRRAERPGRPPRARTGRRTAGGPARRGRPGAARAARAARPARAAQRSSREGTPAGRAGERPLPAARSSQFRGVSWHKHRHLWQARPCAANSVLHSLAAGKRFHLSLRMAHASHAGGACTC